MSRGLDDDEMDLLDPVERAKVQAAQQLSIEEQKEMQEFMEVSYLDETEEMQRLGNQAACVPSARPALPAAQENELQAGVVRKRKASELDSDKKDKEMGASVDKVNIVSNENTEPLNDITPSPEDIGALHCVGVLPGSGLDDTSSDSNSSSDVEVPPTQTATSQAALIARLLRALLRQ